MFEELADGVRTINFKAIGRAAELLQQAKIICPEEDAVRVVEQQRRAELSEKSGRLASQLTIRDSILYALKLRRRCWYRENYLGPPKRRPRLHRLTDGGCIQLAACCNSANCSRSSLQKYTSIHLLSPKRISPQEFRLSSEASTNNDIVPSL